MVKRLLCKLLGHDWHYLTLCYKECMRCGESLDVCELFRQHLEEHKKIIIKEKQYEMEG